MRPLLRPGTHVLDRGDGHLQVGLDPASALVLPDTPAVRESLAGLDGSIREGDDAVLALLAAESLVLDEQAVLPLSAAGLTGGPAATAALARHRGTAAPAAAARRSRTGLLTLGFGPEPADDDGSLVAHVVGLAERAGIGTERAVPPPRARTAAPAVPVADPGRCVGVLAGIGEPDRELADPWTRDGVPYVVVRLTEGKAVVGPFVVPGEGACLRCVDAHHTDADRSWPLLVHQYIRATRAPRTDGLGEPADPTLVALAAAWAARDLASHADGVRPSTWSATLTLDAQLSTMETRRWLRHPECGCSWQ